MRNWNEIGVIFDMDGVLIDSAKPHFRSWQLLGKENGVEITKEQFADSFGRHNGDIIPMLFGSVGPKELSRLADRKETLYREIVASDPPLVTGAAELIHGLHERGAILAVGSSGPPANIELVLSALGCLEKMSAIVSGDDVVRGKPDPQVFTLACQQLRLNPENCVVIEDAPVGVQAARAAGTKSIGICLYHPPDALCDADLILSRLADVTPEAIRELVF